MGEEQILNREEIDGQLLEEAIKIESGICKHLYHGTLKSVAQKIQRPTEIEIGADVGWLGKGVYCYHLDVEASRIWARIKYKTNKIAVLTLTADLGNILFASKELHQFFQNRATELIQLNLDINMKVGYIIERFIKEIITPDLNIEIHSVARTYIFGQRKIRRPALMYSLRKKGMITDFGLYWEEL